MKRKHAKRAFGLLQFASGVLERLLGAHSFSEIAGYLGKADHPAVGVLGCGDDDVRPEFGAVFADTPAFILDTPVPGGDIKFALRFASVLVFLRVEYRKVLTHNLVC